MGQNSDAAVNAVREMLIMNESIRTVKCLKLEKELPGLERPPFPGELGRKIYENISQEAWSMWKDDMQIKVLNEYRLNMGDRRDYDELMRQMRIFLNLSAESAPVEVENEQRGRGK